MKQVTVGIPTVGRYEVTMTLLSVAMFHEGLVKEVLVIDSGDESICKYPEILAIEKMLALEGIKVRFRREPRDGIGKARAIIFEQCRTPYLLMMDDDAFLFPDTLRKLFLTLEDKESCAWAVSFNEDFFVDRPMHPFYDADPFGEHSLAGSSEWSLITQSSRLLVNFFFSREFLVEKVKSALTISILIKMSTVSSKLIELLKRFPKGMPREDMAITVKLGAGAYVANARSGHFGGETKEYSLEMVEKAVKKGILTDFDLVKDLLSTDFKVW